jgi:nickel/cobalt transporter (NicO) family protein
MAGDCWPGARHARPTIQSEAGNSLGMPQVLLIFSALALGFLHGLGADHLMAIATLSISTVGETPARQRAHALGVAVRFALGHALLLALGAGALVALGWSLPLVVERGGELLGGVLLVVLGVTGIWSAVSGKVYTHSHRHGHEPAGNWHLHIGRQDHHPQPSAHSHLPTVLGAAFAVSSLRALTMLAPFGTKMASSPLSTLLMLIGVFALGILLSMSLFGVAFARLMSAAVAARLGQGAAIVMACASIALGIYWIGSS